MQSHTARVDGIDMRWEETGSGDPIILLHGTHLPRPLARRGTAHRGPTGAGLGNAWLWRLNSRRTGS